MAWVHFLSTYSLSLLKISAILDSSNARLLNCFDYFGPALWYRARTCASPPLIVKAALNGENESMTASNPCAADPLLPDREEETNATNSH